MRSKIIESAIPPRKNGMSGVMKYNGRRENSKGYRTSTQRQPGIARP